MPTRHPPRPRPSHHKQRYCPDSGLNYYVSLPPEGTPVNEVIVFCHGMGQSGASAMRMVREKLRELKPNAAIYTPTGPIEPEHGQHDRGHLWVGIPMGRDEEGQKIRPSREMEQKLYKMTDRVNSFADARLRAHGLKRSDLLMSGWSEGAMMAAHSGLDHPEACKGIFSFSGPIYHLRPPRNNSPLFYSCAKKDEVIYPSAHRHTLTALNAHGANAVVHLAEPAFRTCWNKVRNWHYEGPDHPSPRRRQKYLKVTRTTGHEIHPTSVDMAWHFHTTGQANPTLGLLPVSAVPYKPLNIGTMERVWPLIAHKKRRLLFVHSEQMAEEALAKLRTAVKTTLTNRPLKVARTFALTANLGRALAVSSGELPPLTAPYPDNSYTTPPTTELHPSRPAVPRTLMSKR